MSALYIAVLVGGTIVGLAWILVDAMSGGLRAPEEREQ